MSNLLKSICLILIIVLLDSAFTKKWRRPTGRMGKTIYKPVGMMPVIEEQFNLKKNNEFQRPVLGGIYTVGMMPKALQDFLARKKNNQRPVLGGIYKPVGMMPKALQDFLAKK